VLVLGGGDIWESESGSADYEVEKYRGSGLSDGVSERASWREASWELPVVRDFFGNGSTGDC